MKQIDDSDRLFPPERDGWHGDRANDIDRQFLLAAAQVCLEIIADLTKDREILYDVANGLHALNKMYETSEAVIARHEGRGLWDPFRLLHRQLMGYALEFAALAGRSPDHPCGAFKARQLNQVLQPLKGEMEEDMDTPLSLVPEDGSLTYSDVCVLLRAYQDVSASYVHKHYNGNPPILTPFPVDLKMRDIQDEILMYCTDEPRSVLQIAEMLGFKDKKTVRKYLNPLLDAGLLARTVPDRPNSRNQKYLTARPC